MRPLWSNASRTSGGHRTWRLFVVASLLLGACGGDATEPDAPRTFNVLSESFNDGEQISVRFTCDGADVAPSLGWEHPEPSESFALTMTDDDADGFVHWTVLGIPGDVRFFPENAPPSIASEGMNDFGTSGYRGPCPPDGDPAHTYTFTVYALDRPASFFNGTAAGEDFTASQMLDAIRCCVVATGKMSVRYDR
jgi:Raf kinase inhibitor-like YbhB/YbcL family protein